MLFNRSRYVTVAWHSRPTPSDAEANADKAIRQAAPDLPEDQVRALCALLVVAQRPKVEPDQVFRFERPPADVQQGWESIRVEIAEAKGDPKRVVEVGGSHLGEMAEHIARYCKEIDGEEVSLKSSDVLQSMSHSGLYQLWSMFMMACQMNEAERGKSQAQSNALSTPRENTTARDVPTVPSTSADAPIH